MLKATHHFCSLWSNFCTFYVLFTPFLMMDSFSMAAFNRHTPVIQPAKGNHWDMYRDDGDRAGSDDDYDDEAHDTIARLRALMFAKWENATTWAIKRSTATKKLYINKEWPSFCIQYVKYIDNIKKNLNMFLAMGLSNNSYYAKYCESMSIESNRWDCFFMGVGNSGFHTISYYANHLFSKQLF